MKIYKGISTGAVVLLSAILGLASLTTAHAGSLADSINFDKPQIDLKQIRSEMILPAQIASSRPIAVNLNSGKWASVNGQSVWTYGVEVPNASRLFFANAHVVLPEGSKIVVGDGDKFSNEYQPNSVVDGKFSPALVPGSRLVIQIFSTNQTATEFSFNRLFIGAPSTAELNDYAVQYAAAKNANTLPAACANGNYSDGCRIALAQNYFCHISPANKIVSRGAVGLVITTDTSALSCSGTLVNNQKNDGKNYIYTAAHCAINQGTLAQYNTNTITAYWDRTNSCGATQDQFFDQTGPTTSGYTTAHVNAAQVANTTANNDSWLLVSNAAIPVGANPIWQAVDASVPTSSYLTQETTFTKTLLVTYGKGFTKQIMSSNGPVYNGGGFNSNGDYGNYGDIYNVVSWVADYIDTAGSVGASVVGASGSGLFDQNNALRGSITASTTTAPDATYFYRVDLAWDSNNGFSGVTPITPPLKNFLDPNNTGVRQVPMFKDTSRTDNIDVLFTADQALNVASGTSLTFTYLTDDAVSCTASASPANAGWTGTVTPSNTVNATKTVVAGSGTQTFTLTCLNAGGFSKSRVVTLNPSSTSGGTTGGTTGGSTGGSTGGTTGGTTGSSSGSSGGGGPMPLGFIALALLGFLIRKPMNKVFPNFS